MSTTGKTPISLLNEMLVRKGLTPIYSLKQSGVGKNQGTFVYEVACSDLISAVGEGRSKKEAKQEAAKNALTKIRNCETDSLSTSHEEIEEVDLIVISPYEDEMKENAVGGLIEMCATHNMPAPMYTLVREDGPPHAKHFQFKCQVSAMEEFAVGRTKRQAKQMAAQQMMKTFSDLQLVDELPKTIQINECAFPENPQTNAAFAKFNQIKNDILRMPLGLQVGHSMMSWTVEQLKIIKEISTDTDDLHLFDEYCSRLNLSKEVVRVETTNEDVFILLILGTTPENKFVGIGNTKDAALNYAARSANAFIQAMAC